jgi:hypothetical protein
VVLLTDIEFEIRPEFVGETATMASGRTVRDHVGIKNTLFIPTGWLSPTDLARLCQMIGAGDVLTIDYPDVDGDQTGEFWVSLPVRKAFSYGADGVSQWYGVELTAEQYGVSSLEEPPAALPGTSASIRDGTFVITSGTLGASIDSGRMTLS